MSSASSSHKLLESLGASVILNWNLFQSQNLIHFILWRPNSLCEPPDNVNVTAVFRVRPSMPYKVLFTSSGKEPTEMISGNENRQGGMWVPPGSRTHFLSDGNSSSNMQNVRNHQDSLPVKTKYWNIGPPLLGKKSIMELSVAWVTGKEDQVLTC